MMTPFVSVVIVNYNGKQYLPGCLNALAEQIYPRDYFEVIVSDNGSTDGSVELLEKDYPWVNVMKNGRNLGFARGNNVAFQAARGEYLIALNNDTAPIPDWIEKLVQEAEKYPRTGLVNGHSRLFYDQIQLTLESDSFIPGNDPRRLGVMISGIESGTPRGIVQYLEGFYGWEEDGGLRYRWTDGKAVLGIPVPPGSGDWNLDLMVSAPRPTREPVQVWVKAGDETLGKWEVGGLAPQLCRVMLPAASRKKAEPLVQNAGSILNKDGYGKDRGTYANNNEMFFEVDHGQYQSEVIFAGCGANLLLRRAMLDEIGPFDDHFFTYYEDTDLSWRCWLAGWEVRYTSEAIIRHIHCGTSKEWSPAFIFYTERNRLAMLMKNGSGGQAVKNWIRYFGGVARRTFGLVKATVRRDPVRLALRRQLKTQYRVVISLITWLPVLLWQRMAIQRRRTAGAAEIKRWQAAP
jgi:GT2 family glycosyltransferase